MNILKLLYFDTSKIYMKGGSNNNKGNNSSNNSNNKGNNSNNKGNNSNNKGNNSDNKGNNSNNNSNSNNKGNNSNNKGNNSNNNSNNSNNNSNSNSKKNDRIDDESSSDEKSLLSAKFEIFNELKIIVVNIYTWLKDGLLTWVLIPILFGSVAPAMPFFIFMAIMFAMLKFLMGIFRNL